MTHPEERKTMCGVTGFLGLGGAATEDVVTEHLMAMTNAVVARGPDDQGHWSDMSREVAIGHRRLSIVDLSPAGHQPMLSASGRFVIAYNGEIYNHQELRQELSARGLGPRWRGHSDTETLLAAIEAWGVEAAVQRCIGMFAIALWDRQSNTLTLARDRVGEKPLYYGWQGTGGQAVFLFGSQLNALRAHPAFEAAVRRDALALFLRYNYIPAPYSIFEGIYKLLPGSLLTVSLTNREPKLQRYWSLADVIARGSAQRNARAPGEVVDELEVLLKSAVAQQMVADVPLGAFLSGGIDSSTVVALMQAQSRRPVRTFTIGFSEKGYSEAEHAKAVAAHLGTDHTELYVTPEQAMNVIPRLADMYDEPFADSSQIPTFLVSQLARQHVTVSLSGDAGDELFCGYNRYLVAAGAWRRLSAVPQPLLRLAARAITAVPPQTWNTLTAWLPSARSGVNWGDRLHKGADVLDARSIDDLYLGLVSHWPDPTTVVPGGVEAPTFLSGNAPALPELHQVERMMALDMLTYLPDDILAKLDRAAMSVSLETPFSTIG
jgi:asparagine synthase (glutamine-hydrolysing)